MPKLSRAEEDFTFWEQPGGVEHRSINWEVRGQFSNTKIEAEFAVGPV